MESRKQPVVWSRAAHHLTWRIAYFSASLSLMVLGVLCGLASVPDKAAVAKPPVQTLTPVIAPVAETELATANSAERLELPSQLAEPIAVVPATKPAQSPDFNLSVYDLVLFVGDTSPSVTSATIDGRFVSWQVTMHTATGNFEIETTNSDSASMLVLNISAMRGVRTGEYPATVSAATPDGQVAEKTLMLHVVRR